MFFVHLLGVLITPMVLGSSFPEFSDKFLYDISWNEPLSEQDEETNTREKVVITTKENEKYQCLIPQVKAEEDSQFNIENGPRPEALLSDVLLGSPKKCSVRLEPYWTYQVCHGQHVIQFHEEKDTNGDVKRDEYVLGKLTVEETAEILAGPKTLDAPTEESKKVPTRMIDGRETPYFSIEMSNGTPCDLSGRPRSSKVLYVCHLAANNEVISVKEVTTCEYEVIVLTQLLCGNPAYLVKNDPVNDIQCHPLDGSPNKPSKLQQDFAETLTITLTTPTRNIERPKPAVDEALKRQFLEGSYCLVGGTGWWNYEFCNGKHVQQFHQEYNKPKVKINLGFWDKNEHMKMVREEKIKPKGKNHVIHWYSNGDICDLTGKPRTATVILTCKEGTGQQLSIYMTEPSTCKYQIGVESPVLCPFVENSDENGLFDHML